MIKYEGMGLFFGVFERWKAMVENETDLMVKSLQSDNEEGYVDDDFKKYCADNRIKMNMPVV